MATAAGSPYECLRRAGRAWRRRTTTRATWPGVLLFNRGDYFEAHEVWEDLWAGQRTATSGSFYQGLIQAAVGLCHFGNGNLGGAVKLYRSSRDYMAAVRLAVPGAGRGRLLAADGATASPSCWPAPSPTAATAPDPDRLPVIAPGPAAGPLARPGGRTCHDEDDRGSHERRPAVPGRLRGMARLFPLPNLVLFPHVVQPLHIFEPRYRQMTADALAGDRLSPWSCCGPAGRRTTTSGRPSTRSPAWAGSQRGAAGRRPLQPAAARPEPGPHRRGGAEPTSCTASPGCELLRRTCRAAGRRERRAAPAAGRALARWFAAAGRLLRAAAAAARRATCRWGRCATSSASPCRWSGVQAGAAGGAGRGAPASRLLLEHLERAPKPQPRPAASSRRSSAPTDGRGRP